MTNKKIGLILSGGGTHGFAQVGALKILEEHGIKPDLIIGCSVGSLVGAALASGHKMEDIEKTLLKENILTFITPSMGRQGLIKGEKIVKFLLKTIKVEKFEDLKIPLIVNATDVKNGGELVFKKGPLLPALSASISVPGIFAPIKHEDTILVDGGFYDMVPMHLAKDMDIIIIVDVSQVDENITNNSSVISILKQSIVNLQQHIIELNIQHFPEDKELILINPDVSKYGYFEYKKGNHVAMLKLGEHEAKKVLSDERNKKILGI